MDEETRWTLKVLTRMDRLGVRGGSMQMLGVVHKRLPLDNLL